MRLLFTAALLCLAASAARAQTRTAAPNVQVFKMLSNAEATDRPVLGVATTGGDRRDTLGLLIADVTRNGPAEKAGLEAGDRLVTINGVSLKASRDDAGEPETANVLSNRLRREIGKHKAGDDVTLDVWSGGKIKSVKAKLVAASALSEAIVNGVDEHGAIGITIGGSGSKRDTTGVFISEVHDGGPADKSGIVEGERIASINGVDVRVPREDAGDAGASSMRVQRLQRELSKVKPGQTVELVLAAGGKSRTVKLTTVKPSDINGFEHGEAGRMLFMPTPPMPPMPPIHPELPLQELSAIRARIGRDAAELPALREKLRAQALELPALREKLRAQALELPALREHMQRLRELVPATRVRMTKRVMM